MFEKMCSNVFRDKVSNLIHDKFVKIQDFLEAKRLQICENIHLLNAILSNLLI